MSRPAAVTASAVVALIGSLLALLLAGVMVVGAYTAPMQVPAMRGPLVGSGTLLAALAALGVATGVGVLRLRPWARMSMLVFGGFMAVVSFLSALVLAFVPIPAPPGAPISESSVRIFMVGFYAIPLLIGVWWLVLFNRAATKEAFASGGVGEPSRRPLSISIVGWLFIVGGISTVFMVLAGMPALLFSFLFEGWSARLVYAVMGAISLYLGWGLLKLDERARVLTLVWSGFALLHGAYFMLVPAARDRMREMQAMYPVSPQGSAATVTDMTAFTFGIMAVSYAVLVACVWVVIRHKPAFNGQSDVSPPDPPAFGA
jgi:hypothetical protein